MRDILLVHLDLEADLEAAPQVDSRRVDTDHRSVVVMDRATDPAIMDHLATDHLVVVMD